MKNEIEKMRTTATDIIRFILLFLLALAVIAPVIGTVYIFFWLALGERRIHNKCFIVAFSGLLFI